MTARFAGHPHPHPQRQRDVERHLSTFRRIPPAVIIDMAGKEFYLGDPSRCVCGWAFRCDLAQAAKVNDGTYGSGMIAGCVRRFGGEYSEWSDIFFGVTDDRMPRIEEAFHLRVAEAACELRLAEVPVVPKWDDND